MSGDPGKSITALKPFWALFPSYVLIPLLQMFLELLEIDHELGASDLRVCPGDGSKGETCDTSNHQLC